MRYYAPFQLLKVIHAALSLPARGRKWQIQPWAARVASAGWVSLVDLVDAMESQDPRIYGLGPQMKAACEIFELPLRAAMAKPRNRNSEGMLYPSLTAVDAAALMVMFQQLGFEVDPSALIVLLQPKLRAQSRFSLAELEVLFYEKGVDRAHLYFTTKPPPVIGEREKFKTDRGYRVELVAKGECATLDVKGPLFRPPKARVDHTCEYCGWTYTKGDMDAAIEHRRRHSRHQRSFDPRPNPAFARRLAVAPNPDVVKHGSPKWMHEEVYERAVMFKREMEFDFIQWNMPFKGRPPEEGVAYLLAEVSATSTIAGACAFRERSGQWTMDWAWIAPKFRRRGIMQRYWPRFLEAYGDFPLEYPLSDAMKDYVLKHGSPVQRQRLLSDLASAGAATAY